MESEIGIIIVGHCRAGKTERIALMRQLLKEKLVLCGVGFNHTSSASLGLSSSFEIAAIAFKKLNDAMMDLKKITPDKIISMNDYFKDEALKLRSFQEDLNTIVYEKAPSKFISRPINNFRKR